MVSHPAGVARQWESQDRMKGNTPMATMTDNEWRSFLTAGTRLAHIALTRRDGRPHVTPVCFILDGDELAFALSPGSVKGKSLAQTRSNTSARASPTATTPPNPQRTSLNHSYRKASPQFGSASPTSSPDPASADTPHARRVRELWTPSPRNHPTHELER